MILGLDHLVIAAGDPDAAISELASALGVPAGTSGGRHNAWGTRNRLLWLGDTYIELLTVFDPRLAERSWLGEPALYAIERGEPEAIAWAISTDDIDLDRAELNSAGARLAPAIDGERRRPDGQIVRWRLSLPPEADLARPFLIEHDVSAAEWTPDDRAARAATDASVAGLALPVEAIEGLPEAAEGVTLGEQVVGLAPSATMPTVRIAGLSRGGVTVEALGCRWLLD